MIVVTSTGITPGLEAGDLAMLRPAAARRSLAFGGSRSPTKVRDVLVVSSLVVSRWSSSVQKENNRVPPPWGRDMEEALIAQAEAIRKTTISVPPRRRSSWCRSIGLWLVVAILLFWFLFTFAMRHSRAVGLGAIRNGLLAAAGREALTPL